MPLPSFDLQHGLWWRFSAYEIRDRYLRPAKGARFEEFDPWAEFREAREGSKSGRSQTAVEGLINLARKVRTKEFLRGAASPFLTQEVQEELLEWCARFGLLGLLPHRCLSVHYCPRYTGRSEGELQGLSQQAWIRSAAHSLWDGRGSSGYLPIPPGKEGEPYLLKEPYEDLEPPGVTLWPMGEFEGPSQWMNVFSRATPPEKEPLVRTWGKFFPDVPEEDRETYDYPDVFTEGFWRLYGEPVEAFLYGAAALAGAAEELMNLQTSKAPPDITSMMLRIIPILQPLGIQPEADEMGSITLRWNSPSLAALLGAMLATGAKTPSKILICPYCDNLFISHAGQARFCSAKCRQIIQAREFRAAQKKKNVKANTKTGTPVKPGKRGKKHK